MNASTIDSTPPSHRSESRFTTKTPSRLNRIRDYDEEHEETVNLSVEIKETPSPSNLSLVRSESCLPLKELLLLSPSPYRRSKSRVVERVEIGEEFAEPNGSRRRCKRGVQMGQMGCGSPRNCRRSRRRMEVEIREEKDVGVEELGKVRKRRSGRPKKEKLSLVPSVPSSYPSPKSDDGGQPNLDRIGQLILDLILWKDVAKSSLWFGFGSLCFLSSCFAREINFSIFSAISQLGLLLLGASFISNSFYQRNEDENRREFKLKEDDILRVAKVILPPTNLVIAKARVLFSGDPSVTLKVVPFLLVGAEYGNLLTLRRFCAIGFFVSFTAPKLYSCYSSQINEKVEYLKWWVLETWRACSHKKIVAASAVTAFWNLSSVKTLIITAFISLVIIRYCKQHLVSRLEGEAEEAEPQHQQHTLVIVEVGSKKSS